MRRALRLAAYEADVPMSPAAIAAGVPKSQELVEAEQKATALHAEREQNLARVRELEPLLDDPVERPSAAREFRGLILRRRALEAEITASRASLLKMQREHETQIAAALYPLERETANAVLAALGAIRSSAAILAEIQNERTRALNRPNTVSPIFPYLGEIERIVRSILARPT